MTLAFWYTVAQLAPMTLPVIALVAGVVAFLQYRSASFFSTVKYVEFLEDKYTRDQRRKIIKEVPKQTGDWWLENDDLEKAAGIVCARYGLVGALTKSNKRARRFIAREWADNICRSYETLKPYLAYRADLAKKRGTPGGFHQYTLLYDEAMRQIAIQRARCPSN
jgi:hypothetical protein